MRHGEYYIGTLSSSLHNGKWEILNLSIFKAAYETGALRDAKGKLERSLEDITLRFTLERRQRVFFYVIKIPEIPFFGVPSI